jgi:phosphate transport system substrate-binding protein
MRTSVLLKTLLLAAWCAIVLPATAMAGTYDLKDGSTIRGDLASSSNGTCVITRRGGATFTLDCTEIVRADPPLPQPFLPDSPKLRVAGSNTIGAKLMPALLVDFAKSRGAQETPDLPRIVAMDQMIIEPRPLLANLWETIDLGAHGSGTGFQALAALAVERQLGSAGGQHDSSRTTEGVIAPQLEDSSVWKSIEVGAGGASNQNPVKAAAYHQTSEASRIDLIALAQGQAPADIAMSSRRVTPAEVAALSVLGPLDNPASEHVIALDGLAILTNRSNRVETLTVDQIMKIYTGQITDWAEVGGWPGPIVPYARNEISGTYDTFKHLVLKGVAMSPKVSYIEDSRELSGTVANDPNAIGFVGMSYVGESKAVSIRECSLVYSPTNFNAKTEEYPLSRRLYLYVPEKRSKWVEDFLEYTNTPRAQRIVARNSYVDLSIEPDFSGDQRRLRTAAYPSRRNRDDNIYANMLENGGRLSVTLRFRTNSANIDRPDLDSRALRDLQRIRDYMNSPQGSGHKITLVGFTDSVGDFGRNRSLSLGRANSIAKELQNVPIAETLGLGPNFPVACNDTDAGRERNRRVEVWITK